ncbi:MAG: DNA repair protein RecN [Caldilineaceae bacterium]|nr:DNA repair protein RecN [Caldilineaceae bacterium]MBP8107842.1 DNA repair protein RecN [Caldilineaceae bacterium]MBP8122970.1 DNA repair protein RecN [Caldilineaceae bacterium]MBP9073165.1 DNA repair protein RecN [Caldilineaceae bacterium]
MLAELHIRNFAIIDDLQLGFGAGLNILTGETGAGKSIIIDAVGLLLGDRASAEWVRAGTEVASVEATFELPIENGKWKMENAGADENDGVGETGDVRGFLESQGLNDPDNPDWVTLNREVRLNGRNVCRINGRAVSLQILADVAANLVDIHGQGEHLTLLKPRTHIHLLDRYAGLMPLRSQVAEEVAKLRRVRSELHRLRQDARTIAQRVDMLGFQAEEIFAATLRPGEDEALESERRRLSNAESLLKLAQAVTGILSDGDGEMPAAIDLVSEAVGRLDKLERIDPDMAEVAAQGQTLVEQLGDLARSVQDYADELEFNPSRLATVENRLELIDTLKRKYGDDIPAVIEFGRKAQAELDELGNWEVKTAALEEEESRYLRQVGQLGTTLSAQRQAAGERMARQVEAELADLKMEKAQFGVDLAHSDQPDGAFLADGRRVAFDATGIDKVEFLISANPGEPLKPLAKVASGGETARLMLALKSVLAYADATPTLIFDEIDQGIGGRVGGIVGKKLWRLTDSQPPADATGLAPSAMHQVLCITHLPQLAAYGDQHFTVNKRILSENGSERTTTLVNTLAGDARISELMQMLGATTPAGRRSVEEMLEEVGAVKGKA